MMADQSGKRGVQAPPNYSSRRVQVRLLLLVAAFMLVVVMMEEAGKLKYYAWMWAGEVPDQAAAEPDVETRLPRQPATDGSPAGSVQGSASPAPDAEALEAAAAVDDPLQRTILDGWIRSTAGLTRAERMTFQAVLYKTRHTEPLTQEEKIAWAPILDEVADGWDRYFEQAREAIDDDSNRYTDAQVSGWKRVLKSSEQTWRNHWLPVLNASFDNRLVGAAELEDLAEMQGHLDRMALANVKDSTIFRTVEREAWFRLLEQLRDAPLEEIESRSSGTVDFLPLFKQPRDYRGRLVTVRGSARLGYRVDAPANPFGIEDYYMLWVKPRGGPNSPIVVYTLDVPIGLPPMSDRQAGGETELRHEVAVTGYFFKNWAYRSKEGINVAPLILAKMPHVEDEPSLQDMSPSRRAAIIVAGCAGLVAIVFTLMVWRIHRSPARSAQFITRHGANLKLPPDEVRAGVADSLEKLELDP
ncbi:MAG: hypothetical protein QGG36_19685 [Pirellulaceae bacterium]|nr:hypothetical protein [Pirellulaceae bacterium]